MVTNRNRHCSQETFYHEPGVKRKWSSYSMSMDAIFCIPCFLFTDSHSQGEKFRANQGNAFVVNGYSNWKNKGEKICKHETCDAHLNAKIAQVLFQGGWNIESLLDHQSNENEKRRLADVKINRELLERIIDVILLLGRQGLAFRGHNENLVLDTDSISGNFLEVLKMLGSYDERIGAHLRKVKEDHKHVKIQSQKVKKKKKGPGSKITFLSNKSQNKLISIIGDQITNIIIDICLKVLGKRYDILLQVLEKVIGDKSLEDKQRAVAVGLRQSLLKKEIIATACFFKEIFGITGP